MRALLSHSTLLVTLALPSVALAERPEAIDTSRSDSVELQYEYARGQSSRYSFIGARTVEGLHQTDGSRTSTGETLTLALEIQSVEDDGSAIIAANFPEVELLAADLLEERELNTGSETRAVESARVTFTVSEGGTLLERNHTIDESDIPRLANYFDPVQLLFVELPDEEVAIGDSWVQNMELFVHDPEEGLRATVNITYTVAGFALVGSREQLVIDAVYESSTDGDTVIPLVDSREQEVTTRGYGTGYILFDVRAGSITELGAELGTVDTVGLGGDDRAFVSTVHLVELSRDLGEE